MRILTICQGGNCRSVAMAYLLKYKYGHDALACGWEKNSPSTLLMLGKWAEKIVIMEDYMKEKIPQSLLPKTICYDIGPDRWCNSFHPEILGTLDHMVKSHGFFIDKELQVNDDGHSKPNPLSRAHL